MASPAPAGAADALRIGVQFGMPYIPFYVADHEKLFEKHLAAEGAGRTAVTLARFSGSSALNDALLSGQIDMAVYASTALLVVWDKTRNTSAAVIGVCGVTTMPASLVTTRPELKSLQDIGPADRIATPAAISTSAYVLRLAAEKAFGDGNRFNAQLVIMPNPEAVAALLSRTEVNGMFTVPPFPEYVMRQPGIHRVLSQKDVFGGPSSTLVLGASKRYADDNPAVVRATIAALAESYAFIGKAPRQAADIYLEKEPSKTFDAEFVTGLLADGDHEYGTGIFGLSVFAEYLARHGEMKARPASWKELFLPYIHGQEGS